MLAQNLISLLTLALSVSALPHNTPTTTNTNSPELSLHSSVPITDHHDATIDASAPVLSAPVPSAPVPSAPVPSKPLPVLSSIDASAPVLSAPVPSKPLPALSSIVPPGEQDRAIPHSPLTPKPSPAPAPATVSGEDGEGNQEVGNGGQNAGNAASNTGHIRDDYTVNQATKTCGNAQLSCCNKVSKKGDTTNAGLLGAAIGGGDLDVQCSPINIPTIGIQVPINKACGAEAACCQGYTAQNGLVNVGCIALASLI